LNMRIGFKSLGFVRIQVTAELYSASTIGAILLAEAEKTFGFRGAQKLDIKRISDRLKPAISMRSFKTRASQN